MKRAAACIGGLVLALILAHDAYGQAMTSSHYKIQTDSVNFGGGRSVSSSYSTEDTLGESATGVSSSTNYALKAGYQQMQEVTLAVIPASGVTLSPSFGGVTGGTSNGSTTFKVTTDDPAGYTASIKASSSPALASSLDSFADYVPAGANPDFTFTNGSSASSFAFSPEGADIDQRFKDNGSSCNIGSSDTVSACWDGLSTSNKTIVTRTTPNSPSGASTTISFRAASGNHHIQVDGVYTATTTVTILPL